MNKDVRCYDKDVYCYETGVLLKPGDHEFEFYNRVNPKLPYGFYDEDQYVFLEDDLGKTLEYVKDYVKKGVEGTYGIVAYWGYVDTDDCEYEAIVEGEATIDQYTYYQYVQDIHYSIAKIDGVLVEGFLEAALKESERSNSEPSLVEAACEAHSLSEGSEMEAVEAEQVER